MSSSTNTEETISGILREFGELKGTIYPDKDLHTELGVKSVNFISILLALEDKFAISIEDSQFSKARTFNSLVSLVNGTVN